MARAADQPSGRRGETVFPGFRDLAARRRTLVANLVERRRELGLSQTDVAARMGTSQSAVARLESGGADVRLTTLERYAAALGRELDWRLRAPASGGQDA
ncbi:MAG: helix-turn-helix domain-containing protein [Chloroflexota bacterium]|nr:helix-turn-helix domain-containing protein [Chloroflexota bacterium]